MADVPVSIRVAQVIGITGAAFLSGGILSISYIFVPALQLAPDSVAVHQWHMVYDKGVRLAPPLSLIASSSFAFLSYSLVKTLNQAKGELYGLAALATIGIVPYTLFFMAATNETLINKTAEYKAESKREARIVTKEESMQGLLSRWNMLNYGRGVFPLIGTSLGLYATLV